MGIGPQTRIHDMASAATLPTAEHELWHACCTNGQSVRRQRPRWGRDIKQKATHRPLLSPRASVRSMHQAKVATRRLPPFSPSLAFAALLASAPGLVRRRARDPASETLRVNRRHAGGFRITRQHACPLSSRLPSLGTPSIPHAESMVSASVAPLWSPSSRVRICPISLRIGGGGAAAPSIGSGSLATTTSCSSTPAADEDVTVACSTRGGAGSPCGSCAGCCSSGGGALGALALGASASPQHLFKIVVLFTIRR
jgi:hypothetical protein